MDVPDPAKLSTDECKKASDHYNHRAGLKVSHCCCRFLGELMDGPPRGGKLEGVRLEERLNDKLQEAKDDLILYCSAYFDSLNHPNKDDFVVPFAAAGPYWTYAQITPDVVPVIDWRRQGIVDDDDDDELNSKVELFLSRFMADYWVLGTPDSDNALAGMADSESLYRLADDSSLCNIRGHPLFYVHVNLRCRACRVSKAVRNIFP